MYNYERQIDDIRPVTVRRQSLHDAATLNVFQMLCTLFPVLSLTRLLPFKRMTCVHIMYI